MRDAKITYEQFCTHLDRNVIIEETIYENGEKKIVCTELERDGCREHCKNKLRKNN